MPAVRPRLVFTPSDQTHAALMRLASVSNRRPSAIVADFMQTLTPDLERLSDLLESVVHEEGFIHQAIARSSADALEVFTPSHWIADDAWSAALDPRSVTRGSPA